MSYLKFSTSTIEYTALADDSEKEEKKIESEYFDDQLFANSSFQVFSASPEKLPVSGDSFVLAHSIEVLTPPPSI